MTYKYGNDDLLNNVGVSSEGPKVVTSSAEWPEVVTSSATAFEEQAHRWQFNQ